MSSILPLKFFFAVLFLAFSIQVTQAQEGMSPKSIRDLISADLVGLGLSHVPVNIVSTIDQNLQNHSLTRLYSDLLPSMVRVAVVAESDGLRKSLGGGSGVAVTEDIVLTNCHLLPKPSEFNGKSIYVQDFEKKSHIAKLIGSDYKSDRCVLQLNSKQLNPVKGIRSKDSVKVGELAYAIGSPRGFDHVFTAGHVSWVSGAKAKRKIFLSTVAIAKGSSGGGLFDSSGNLIGITTAYLTDTSQFSVIIPAHDYFLTFGQ